MKSKFKKAAAILAFVLCASMIFTSCAKESNDKANDAEAAESTEATTKETTTAETTTESTADNASADSFTLMVYMCGSDLESEGGSATFDLYEMLDGIEGDNLNLIVETGGAKKWQVDGISADSLQRFKISNYSMDLVDDAGKGQITTAKSLSDFISYTKENYPADRYGLILWDHGGGTIGGYGCDENYDEESMDIADIAQALNDGGCHFDFVGFDCCLMATVEIAKAVSPYANYLIASEENIPGDGWYYTNFIYELSKDPSVSVKDLADTIISDFVSDQYSEIDQGVTLSLTDLSQIDNVTSKLYAYLKNSKTSLESGNFSTLSSARSKARSFGGGEFDQVDIIDYIEKTDVEGADELKAAVQKAVVINGENIEGSNGLSMYYPYYMLDYYYGVSSLMPYVGIDSEVYSGYYDDFVSVMLGGQTDGTYNPYSSDGSDYDAEDIYGYTEWYNPDIVEKYSKSYAKVSDKTLKLTEKDGEYVLSLSDKKWDLITDIKLQAYVDEGKGFISLGEDNFYDFNSDGDLIVDYDNYWVKINDKLVSYFVTESGIRDNGSEYSLGYVPALLNGDKEINIWISFDENDKAEVLGYNVVYNKPTCSRGCQAFNDGDKIEFIFDFYDYNGNLTESYIEDSSTITYSEDEGLNAKYDYIGDLNTEICFLLTDIYNNEYWTEPVSITFK